VASASLDQTVKVWDTATGQELRSLKGHTKSVQSVVFSPDSQRLASASWDGTVKVWDAASGREVLSLKGHTMEEGHCVAFSPEGQRLAATSADRTVKIWDAATGQELQTLKGNSPYVASVAFSPDGQRLASGAFNGSVQLWDAARTEEPRTLKGDAGKVNCVAFSFDGKYLASGGEIHHDLGEGKYQVKVGEGEIRVWDVTSGHKLRTFNTEARSVVFSPDGTRLASGGRDDTVKGWDVASASTELN